jgi:hypothetical protein
MHTRESVRSLLQMRRFSHNAALVLYYSTSDIHAESPFRISDTNVIFLAAHTWLCGAFDVQSLQQLVVCLVHVQVQP